MSQPGSALRVLFVLLATIVPAGRVRAFPGSVRWGYANCATCHYNVAGGGILTPYGRQLSRELLSTKGGEKEPEFAYGLAKLPDWLALGGDLKYLVTSQPDRTAIRLSQADLEAAITRGRLLAVATVGRQSDASDSMGEGWMSRRHYLQVAASSTVSFRLGRFLPNYGVWNGDTSVATRRGLGWDHDSYNLEANWINERFNAAVTGIVAGTDGRPAERGISATVGVFFAGKEKIWLSALSRGRPGLERRAVGTSGVFGIGGRAYLLMETDFQWLRDDASSRSPAWDLFLNACFARETVKGLYVLLLDEMWRPALGSPGSVDNNYGVALRWFPRPHFEVQVRWLRRHREAVSPDYMDGVSGLIHFYP